MTSSSSLNMTGTCSIDTHTGCIVEVTKQCSLHELKTNKETYMIQTLTQRLEAAEKRLVALEKALKDMENTHKVGIDSFERQFQAATRLDDKVERVEGKMDKLLSLVTNSLPR